MNKQCVCLKYKVTYDATKYDVAFYTYYDQFDWLLAVNCYMHNSCSNKCRSQSNMKVNIIIISPICCVTCIEIFEWKNYNVVWCAIYWQVFSEMESVSLMLLVVWQRYCRELILFAQITTSMRASVLKIRKIAIVEVDGDVYASFELESLMLCTDKSGTWDNLTWHEFVGKRSTRN